MNDELEEIDENIAEEETHDPPLTFEELMTTGALVCFVGFIVMLIFMITRPDSAYAWLISLLFLMGMVTLLMIREKGKPEDKKGGTKRNQTK